MAQAAKAPRHNRTLTVDFHDEATYAQLPTTQCSLGVFHSLVRSVQCLWQTRKEA
jgi:hypothetical protein